MTLVQATQDSVTGVDEVGRGSLFGPVVAAAVTLDAIAAARLAALGVRDSKQLSPRRREALVESIQTAAIAWAVAEASVEEIDRLNILQATFLAMRRAIAALDPAPTQILVDGNRPIPELTLPQEAWVGGDQKSVAIASASILAKVTRDRQIIEQAQHYPGYELERNKGYGTATHREAIGRLGITDQHRRSFAPCRPSG